MTIILGGPIKPILDSAGQPATGDIVFTQGSRISTGSGLITTTPVTAHVQKGVLTSLNVDVPFSMPASPANTFVAVSEQFDGAEYDYVTQIPDADSVFYEDLPNLSPDQSGQFPTYQNIIEAAASALQSAQDADNAKQAILDIDPIPAAQKAAANGVASLTAAAVVPDAQLPSRLSDASIAGTAGSAAATAATAAAAPAIATANSAATVAASAIALRTAHIESVVKSAYASLDFETGIHTVGGLTFPFGTIGNIYAGTDPALNDAFGFPICQRGTTNRLANPSFSGAVVGTIASTGGTGSLPTGWTRTVSGVPFELLSVTSRSMRIKVGPFPSNSTTQLQAATFNTSDFTDKNYIVFATTLNLEAGMPSDARVYTSLEVQSPSTYTGTEWRRSTLSQLTPTVGVTQRDRVAINRIMMGTTFKPTINFLGKTGETYYVTISDPQLETGSGVKDATEWVSGTRGNGTIAVHGLPVGNWDFAIRAVDGDKYFLNVPSVDDPITATFPVLSGGAVTVGGSNVITTATAHGYAVSDSVGFIGVGSTGLLEATNYFVTSVPTSTTFTVSLTDGGSSPALTAGAVTSTGKTILVGTARTLSTMDFSTTSGPVHIKKILAFPAGSIDSLFPPTSLSVPGSPRDLLDTPAWVPVTKDAQVTSRPNNLSSLFKLTDLQSSIAMAANRRTGREMYTVGPLDNPDSAKHGDGSARTTQRAENGSDEAFPFGVWLNIAFQYRINFPLVGSGANSSRTIMQLRYTDDAGTAYGLSPDAHLYVNDNGGMSFLTRSGDNLLHFQPPKKNIPGSSPATAADYNIYDTATPASDGTFNGGLQQQRVFLSNNKTLTRLDGSTFQHYQYGPASQTSGPGRWHNVVIRIKMSPGVGDWPAAGGMELYYDGVRLFGRQRIDSAGNPVFTPTVIGGVTVQVPVVETGLVDGQGNALPIGGSDGPLVAGYDRLSLADGTDYAAVGTGIGFKIRHGVYRGNNPVQTDNFEFNDFRVTYESQTSLLGLVTTPAGM